MICVSLSDISFQECIKALSKTEFAEIRMDLLDFSEDQFRSLFAIKRKTVATCHPGKHTEEQRLGLLKVAIEAGAGYVDIDYESSDEYRSALMDFAHAHDSAAIVSYHNFNLTPSTQEMDAIISQARGWGADYVKIATMANSPADNARVLGLYGKYPKLIAFCMGKKGGITRVAAPLLGAEFTFAALDSLHATAPGQFTVGEMIDLYEIVK